MMRLPAPGANRRLPGCLCFYGTPSQCPLRLLVTNLRFFLVAITLTLFRSLCCRHFVRRLDLFKAATWNPHLLSNVATPRLFLPSLYGLHGRASSGDVMVLTVLPGIYDHNDTISSTNSNERIRRRLGGPTVRTRKLWPSLGDWLPSVGELLRVCGDTARSGRVQYKLHYMHQVSVVTASS